ncbi:hypothetical protein D0Z00_002870 [Geotrichum galactomycetum]|uniref:Uncharacterized protein n=1 Tax=Geotrichum galactomycetum TaxID=27317 RepID=A0ACB6V376_9ASCO|nr:hypothetical protein D0Z00_002870 [Geotrichum candidum]
MIDKITLRLVKWASCDITKTVVIKGAGNKAFCAGGDVAVLAKGISDNAETGPAVASKFFKDQYTMDHLIAAYTKPYVALLDGVTMGGGVGLGVHAPFRIATEKTLFAMPETDIGFFTDGGVRLKGYDVVAAGIATHYVPETVLPELEARLAEIISDNKNISTDPFNLVNNVLEEFATDAPEGYEFSLSGKKRKAIDSIFGQSSIEDIISALEADGSEWALKTKKTILGKPPLSVKVTFHALRRGKDLTITDALSKEYQLAKQFMSGDDFVEGVTSKLINKPATAPQWKPATLDEVTASAVSEFINKTDATDALEPITKEDFVDYPHKFGLPAEQDIKNFITGNDGSDRKFKVTKDKVFDHFQS